MPTLAGHHRPAWRAQAAALDVLESDPSLLISGADSLAGKTASQIRSAAAAKRLGGAAPLLLVVVVLAAGAYELATGSDLGGFSVGAGAQETLKRSFAALRGEGLV